MSGSLAANCTSLLHSLPYAGGSSQQATGIFISNPNKSALRGFMVFPVSLIRRYPSAAPLLSPRLAPALSQRPKAPAPCLATTDRFFTPSEKKIPPLPRVNIEFTSWTRSHSGCPLPRQRCHRHEGSGSSVRAGQSSERLRPPRRERLRPPPTPVRGCVCAREGQRETVGGCEQPH